MVAPVFWAAFTVFLHAAGGFSGFMLHSFLMRPRRVSGWLLLPGAYLGLVFWFAAREPHITLDSAPFHRAFIAEDTAAMPIPVRIGTVTSVPAPGARGHVFLFREQREGKNGLLYRATLVAPDPPAWGATVRLHGFAAPADAPPNPGQLDMRRVLRGQGASAGLQASRCETLAAPPPHKRALTVARDALAASLARHVPVATRPLLEASLLNLTANVPDDTRDAFLRSGMQHILAISGQHIGLLLGFLLIAGMCARLSRKVTFLLAALMTAAYIPLVGSPVSVVRSGIMFACLLPAILLERPTTGLHALGITASLDLLLDPHNVLNLGFQLSYAATLALILGAQPAHHAARHVTHRVVRILRHAVTAGLAWWMSRTEEPNTESGSSCHTPGRDPGPGDALNEGMVRKSCVATLHMIILSALVTLFTYPVLAVSTHATTPWGIAGNVATVPVGAAMLVGGLFVWSFDFLLPAAFDPLASAAGATAGACSLLLEGMVFFLAGLPGALRPIAHAPAGWVAGLLACTALVTCLLRKHLFLPALLWGLAIVTAETFRPLAANVWNGLPRVTFLAVGHGDAAVIELRGATLLIDAGDSPRVTRNIILPYLQYRGITRLDAVMITHGDRDHYGGIATLLTRLPVGRIIVPPERSDHASPTWQCVKTVAARNQVPWLTAQAGQRLYAGLYDTLWLIAPDTSQAVLRDADKNDLSLVTLMRTRTQDVLFTGDIEHAGQQALAAMWPLWRGAWLKAPHHGSDRTTMPCFLRAANPARTVVSCGGRRGFPGARVMNALESAGSPIAVTKRHGAITWLPARTGAVEEMRHLDSPPAPSPFLRELLN